ncbi:MAG: oxidase [Flavobacteriales bacterium]|nr:oxidase [Flavobacteriales bacterium]|tara:strand:- start:408 stop:782 length:375 start_codon:yes stop_codon:yes gene_type:complete
MSANSEHSAPGHIIPFSYTLGTFIALLFLTVITVGVAQFDLGALDMPVALLVAGVKASIVSLFFMHLRWDRPINILVLIGSIFFVVLFLVIAMFDTGQNVDLKYSGDSSKVKEVLESQSFPVVQ